MMIVREMRYYDVVMKCDDDVTFQNLIDNQ